MDIDLIGAPAFAVDVLPDGVRYAGINRAHERVTGLRNADMAGKTPQEYFGPDIGERLARNYSACVRRGEFYEYEEHVVLPSGASDWRTTLTPLFDKAGGVVKTILGVAVDITSQKSAERQLDKAHAQLALAFEATGGAFWHFDVANNAYTTSPSMALLAGEENPRALSVDEVMALLPEEDHAIASIEALLSGEVGHETKEYRFRLPGGETRWIRCRRQATRAPDGSVSAVYGVTMDISEEHERELALSRSALQDPLTGIANRRAFTDRLGRLTQRSKADGRPFAVLMLDLDDFKHINDHLGHAAGDAVLSGIAERLQSCLRPTDLAARLGGDEFVVLADGVDTAAAEGLRDRLLKAVDKPVEHDGKTIAVGVSIGQATWRQELSGEQLVAEADVDLYRAKRHRKQRPRNVAGL